MIYHMFELSRDADADEGDIEVGNHVSISTLPPEEEAKNMRRAFRPAGFHLILGNRVSLSKRPRIFKTFGHYRGKNNDDIFVERLCLATEDKLMPFRARYRTREKIFPHSGKLQTVISLNALNSIAQGLLAAETFLDPCHITMENLTFDMREEAHDLCMEIAHSAREYITRRSLYTCPEAFSPIRTGRDIYRVVDPVLRRPKLSEWSVREIRSLVQRNVFRPTMMRTDPLNWMYEGDFITETSLLQRAQRRHPIDVGQLPPLQTSAKWIFSEISDDTILDLAHALDRSSLTDMDITASRSDPDKYDAPMLIDRYIDVAPPEPKDPDRSLRDLREIVDWGWRIYHTLIRDPVCQYYQYHRKDHGVYMRIRKTIAEEALVEWIHDDPENQPALAVYIDLALMSLCGVGVACEEPNIGY